MQLLVFGKPIAQPRHRISTRGGFPRVYLPNDHPIHAYKKSIEDEARALKQPRIEGAVRLECVFSFKATRKTAQQFKISKPDLDNLQKAVMDALTSAGVWIDDAQVCVSVGSKVLGLIDATSISVLGIGFNCDAVEATDSQKLQQ